MDQGERRFGAGRSFRLSRLRWLVGGGVLAVGLVLVGVVARPAVHVVRAVVTDPVGRPSLPAGTLDDASHLNATLMSEVIPVASEPTEAEEQLRELLGRAARDGLKIAVAGSRHTMGGHTVYPGGIAVDMLPFSHMRLEETTDILHVGAGARWAEIIPYLNERGRSVGVMQSNNSFSVGGSISANCHGWQTGRPPIASTVEAFRLMLADGRVVRCSRSENAELFSLALGGYGLFGIILDVELRVQPNARYRIEKFPVALGSYAERLDEVTDGRSGAAFVYGRLDITPGNYLNGAMLNAWRRESGTEGTSTPLRTIPVAAVRRGLFRGSAGSEYGKELRWWAECNLEQALGSATAMRNELLNVGVELYENRSSESTDILHEYFVTPEHFDPFVKRVREITRRHGGDLMNVTVRDVERDDDTFLRYADRRLLCLVMLFHQRRTPEGEDRMAAMTRDLIDAALDEEGRYYLPYRLHATPDQLRRAYPRIDRFFELKRQYDAGEVFQNEFYRRYGRRNAD